MGFSKIARLARDKEFIGKTFNSIKLIKRAKGDSRATWKAECLECGKKFYVLEKVVLSGNKKSCGCKKLKYLSLGTKISAYKKIKSRGDRLIGKRFGKLEILKIYEIQDNFKNRIYCDVKCDCGKIKKVRYDSVKNSKSCGCSVIQKNKERSKKFSAENHLFKHTKATAKKRNLSFTLDFMTFISIIEKNCYYCGQEPTLFYLNDSSRCFRNGIDRMDNSKGYEESNCVPCCYVCNRGKSNMLMKDWLDYINRIVNFYKSSEYKIDFP
jgi:hypothetical protein